MNITAQLAYEKIPHFPASTVDFHAGQLIAGTIANKNLLVMQGRFHFYEGLEASRVTFPIRVMHELGITDLLLTHAVGGMQPHLKAGTLGCISDHINLMGTHPLIGSHAEHLGTRFPDMSEPYDKRLQSFAHAQAQKLDIPLHRTVYAAVSGPSYETPAEINMLQILGADTIGMSVVPEVLVARQLGMKVLALSVITDQALPEQMVPVSHQEVARVARKTAPKVEKLLNALIKEWPE
jgi:purine-nucleoside phosphorylase